MMTRSLTCILLTTLLCFCAAASMSAQDQEMVAPPIPDVSGEPPPDPDTLAPPPDKEWERLDNEDIPDVGTAVEIPFVPPPGPREEIPPPPPVETEPLLAGDPDPLIAEAYKPTIETWRDESEFPQISSRSPERLNRAYIASDDPVTLRVQFDPETAGQNVYLVLGDGVTIDPPDAPVTISATGECVLSAKLDNSVPQSYIVFYCNGVKTVLPLLQSNLARVEAEEGGTGGGQ